MKNNGLLSKPLFLFLAPLFPVLQLYAAHFHRLTIPHVLIAASVFIVALLSIRTLVNWTWKTPGRNDILLALVFASLFFGPFFSTAYSYLFAWVLAFAIAICLVIWRKNDHTNIARGLNIMMLVLIITPIFHLANPAFWQQRSTIETRVKAKFPDIKTPDALPQKANRDFYYIVMDRYARADQLARVYGYDNTPFLNQLKKRGFSVAASSYANYQRTAHSLASSLNLDYLSDPAQPPVPQSRDWLPLYNILRRSRLVRFMKANGFEINTYGSWWETTRTSPLADKNFSFRAWPELVRVLFENSLIAKGLATMGVKQLDSLWLQCQRPGKKFDRIIMNAKSDKRKFVFAHFLVPHPPFVLDEHGNCMSVKTAKSRTRAQNYIGQLKYANNQLIKMIDELQSGTGPKPVIVIQADEGPWPQKYAGNEIGFLGRDTTTVDWSKVTPDDLREKMAILNARYLPGIPPQITKPDTTPVNTYRHILNSYFNLKLKELPDRNFIFESKIRLYNFHDVTDKLAKP